MSSLIPNGKQHFDDNNGRPLVGGKVYFYIPNTSTPKDTYQDQALTILNTNPIILDARGEATIWGYGEFRQVLRDAQDNLIWDRIVTDLSQKFDQQLDQSIQALKDSLASPTGASMIGYKPPFPGSVDRTIDKQFIWIQPEDFGAVGDGVVDDTAAVSAWAAAQWPYKLYRGKYRIKQMITFWGKEWVEGYGSDALIDASQDSFTDPFVLSAAGTYTNLPALSSDTGDTGVVLAFVSAHGLKANDLVGIYNPVDGSFSAARSYYRDGEFCRVHEVESPTRVNLWGRLYSGYTTANSQLYKIDPIRPVYRNMRIKCPATGECGALRISFSDGAVIENVVGFNSLYTSVVMDRSVNFTLLAGKGFTPAATSASAYGVTVQNCQDSMLQGYFYGTRHGVALGGDSLTLCVPNRNIKIVNSTIKNSSSADTQAADVHGNAQYITYENCMIDGGAVIGGRDITLRGNTIRSRRGGGSKAIALYMSEVVGGDFVVEGGTIESFQDAQSDASAPIYLNFLSYAKAAINFKILNSKLIAPSLSTAGTFLRLEINGANYPCNTIIDGVEVDASSAGILLFQRTSSGTGAADFCVVDNVSWNRSGGYLAYPMTGAPGYASTKFRIQTQSSSATVTSNTSSPVAALGSQSFRYAYPKTPAAIVTVNGTTKSAIADASVAMGYVFSLDNTTIRPAALNAKGTNFGGLQYDLQWQVGLAEI